MAWLAAAIVVSCAVLAGLVWAWAHYVEPRLFAPRAPAPRRPAPRRAPSVLPPGEDGHLAFAETLVTAAEMYREECIERAAQPERRGLPAGDVIDVTAR